MFHKISALQVFDERTADGHNVSVHELDPITEADEVDEGSFQAYPEVILKEVIDRGTCISPTRMHMWELPERLKLKSKLVEMKLKYRKKIKTLQQSQRRYVRKISSLQSIIDEFKAKKCLTDKDLAILLGRSNGKLIKRHVLEI